MPAPKKILLQKLSPQTKPYFSALKLVLAALVAGAQFDHSAGDVVALKLDNDYLLTDANAASR